MSNITAIKPDNGAMGILNPKTLEEAMQVAKMLADSSIVPADFQGKPGNVLVAVQWGSELGLAPLQAMQSIAVINGRPSIWGDALLAMVRGSGLLESITEEVEGDMAICTVQRRGEQPTSRTFSMEDAKVAGLASKKGPWLQYPKRMLQLRARAFALRDVFTDVLRGMYMAEEAADMPRMRDVTPVGDAKAKPGVDRVKARLKAKTTGVTSGPNVKVDQDGVVEGHGDTSSEAFVKVMGMINDANDSASLVAITKLAATLTDETEIGIARGAYQSKRDEVLPPEGGQGGAQ